MRWLSPTFDVATTARLAAEANLSPILARLLVLRDITSAEHAHRFLNPQLDHLHDPYLLFGLRPAVGRLESAIARKEPVLIYGDYDVDGTTAIVILKTAIELLGGNADFHVPHRIRDGYGMKDDVIERAAAAGVRLIISVDTGIRAFTAAQAARRAGVDLIVTDHHLPEANEGVPDALAVLNPNQPGCEYPNKDLCGAGVAFKVAQALLTRAGRESLLPSFIKMVAIATIADAVPLTGENRVFARLGLDGLRRPANAGLKALFEVSGLDVRARALTASDVGFRIAPRLNAAGRMDIAGDVIELFHCRDQQRARDIAAKLNDLNAQRQEEEKRIIAAIDDLVSREPHRAEAWCMVIEGEGWHRGVIGICATRVVEKYCRPALVCSVENGEAHGSGRSIHGFHLLNALESCRDLFTRHGGHAAAVGFALPSDRLPQLRAALDAHARAHLTAADLLPSLRLDGELALPDITPELLGELRRLEPFGMGNREPIFAVRGVKLLLAPRIVKEKHLKLKLGDPAIAGTKFQRGLDAIGWRLAERAAELNLVPGDLIDAAFRLGENDHPDFGGLQLTLCDLARAPATAVASL
jgi:single-stranded-DNA-specific exonuclease